VTVKVLADPTVAPAASMKVIVPVHEAAVPLEEFAARLATLICAVSLVAKPTGGKLIWGV